MEMSFFLCAHALIANDVSNLQFFCCSLYFCLLVYVYCAILFRLNTAAHGFEFEMQIAMRCYVKKGTALRHYYVYVDTWCQSLAS